MAERHQCNTQDILFFCGLRILRTTAQACRAEMTRWRKCPTNTRPMWCNKANNPSASRFASCRVTPHRRPGSDRNTLRNHLSSCRMPWSVSHGVIAPLAEAVSAFPLGENGHRGDRGFTGKCLADALKSHCMRLTCKLSDTTPMVRMGTCGCRCLDVVCLSPSSFEGRNQSIRQSIYHS
jgi:hypothetical protein